MPWRTWRNLIVVVGGCGTWDFSLTRSQHKLIHGASHGARTDQVEQWSKPSPANKRVARRSKNVVAHRCALPAWQLPMALHIHVELALVHDAVCHWSTCHKFTVSSLHLRLTQLSPWYWFRRQVEGMTHVELYILRCRVTFVNFPVDATYHATSC